MQSTDKFQLVCLRCPWLGEPAALFVCPDCGGALDARMRLAGARVRSSESPEESFFDLLPVVSPDLLDTGLSRTTPCRPAPRLGSALDVPGLWVKDESRQPTGSTQDRLAAVVVAVFRQFQIAEFVSSSTGNTAVALARAVERDGGMRAHFFCGTAFVDRHPARSDRVELTVVDGPYAQARAAGHAYARDNGLFWEGGFFNWARREGLKTAYLEAFDAMAGKPDVVVQAASSGTGIMAARKGAEEYRALGRMDRSPRLLLAQQNTCAPMARAWRGGRSELADDDLVAEPDGLARAILLGDARAGYPYLHDTVAESGGTIVSVGQQDLVHTRALLKETEDLDVCYSSAAAVAGLRCEARAGGIDRDETVLVNLTGRAARG